MQEHSDKVHKINNPDWPWIWSLILTIIVATGGKKVLGEKEKILGACDRMVNRHKLGFLSLA